jgi:hypothetical protein
VKDLKVDGFQDIKLEILRKKIKTFQIVNRQKLTKELQ